MATKMSAESSMPVDFDRPLSTAELRALDDESFDAYFVALRAEAKQRRTEHRKFTAESQQFHAESVRVMKRYRRYSRGAVVVCLVAVLFATATALVQIWLCR